MKIKMNDILLVKKDFENGHLTFACTNFLPYLEWQDVIYAHGFKLRFMHLDTIPLEHASNEKSRATYVITDFDFSKCHHILDAKHLCMLDNDDEILSIEYIPDNPEESQIYARVKYPSGEIAYLPFNVHGEGIDSMITLKCLNKPLQI